jgi:hypothetical protein
MGGVALCAYMRSGWEASAWLGLARPCWAASPFRYFFISEKKVIKSTIEKEARKKEKDEPNSRILQTIDSRWSTIQNILQINSIVFPGSVFNYL